MFWRFWEMIKNGVPERLIAYYRRLLKMWPLHDMKLHYQQFSPNIRFKIFSMQMNLVCFINVHLIRGIVLRTKSAQEASIARFA